MEYQQQNTLNNHHTLYQSGISGITISIGWLVGDELPSSLQKSCGIKSSIVALIASTYHLTGNTTSSVLPQSTAGTAVSANCERIGFVDTNKPGLYMLCSHWIKPTFDHA